MSVKTSADEHLDKVKENISSSIEELSQIVIHECWGHDQFNIEYREKLEEVFTQLRKIKRDLSPTY